MDIIFTSKRMHGMPASIEVNIVIAAAILFLIHLFLGRSFTAIPLSNYGALFRPGQSLLLFAYGFYLVYIARTYFAMVARKSLEGKPWIKLLLCYYLAVLYVYVLIVYMKRTGRCTDKYLSEEFKLSLPSIEEIEVELGNGEI